MAARKQGQQVLLSPHTKRRVLALSVVRQEAQAEVARWLIEASLPLIERSHEGELQELLDALRAMNVDLGEALQEMATVNLRADGEKRQMRIADLKTADGRAWRKTFPWPNKA